MSELDHTPEQYLTIQSGQYRTINGLCSLSLAIIGASSIFKNDNTFVTSYMIQIVGVLFFIFTLIHGSKTNNDFKNYLDELSETKNLPVFYRKRLNEWYGWVYHLYIYFAFISILIILFILHSMDIKSLFSKS